jgi:hypothetical protein
MDRKELNFLLSCAEKFLNQLPPEWLEGAQRFYEDGNMDGLAMLLIAAVWYNEPEKAMQKVRRYFYDMSQEERYKTLMDTLDTCAIVANCVNQFPL